MFWNFVSIVWNENKDNQSNYKIWFRKIRLSNENKWMWLCSMCNHLQISSLKSIFINVKILILSYKINIFAFTKIVLEQRYLSRDDYTVELRDLSKELNNPWKNDLEQGRVNEEYERRYLELVFLKVKI